MTVASIHLGFEVGTGERVAVPLRNLAVTGQTQESGKTTTLEALASRSNATILTFVTKRGEGSFEDGRRITPYFRDRADWQFVTGILDATLQEKNKFLRPWIIKICRTTKTLRDVQAEVRKAAVKAKGINEGVYTQLEAYLDLIVPEIGRANLAPRLDLAAGLNVMDVSSFATPMQMLFVQSALDWVNHECRNTIVVIPEAWEFIPEKKGSPVKNSAETLVRKGSGIGNHIWVDSQDMAGVDKTILRGCPVWLIGVQREANEIKRNLANIPAHVSRPKPTDVAMLERGQFFACFGKDVRKVYVQPAWMSEADARAVALGKPAPAPKKMEDKVNHAEAEALRAENARLLTEVTRLQGEIARFAKVAPLVDPPPASSVPVPGAMVDMDAIYAEVKRRASADPGVLRLLTEKPEIEVAVQRRTIQIDGSTLRGRIVQLLARGFYDEGATNSATRTELKRTGPDANNGTIWKVMTELLRDGFVTMEGDRYRSVPDMKVRIVEAGA